MRSPMDDELKSVLKHAILTSLPVLRSQLEKFPEPYLVWSKRGNSGWTGKHQVRPNLQQVFNATRDQLHAAAAGFAGLFLAKHPEYGGLVGLAGLEHHRILNSDTQIPESALRWLWWKDGTFDSDDASVGAVVNEFAQFVESPTVRLRFQAQLLNFRMDADRLTLPDDVIIRRLSEEEVSVLDGGPLITLGFMRPRFSGPHEFAIEGEVEVVKQVGTSWASAPSALEMVKVRLAKAILCLRTFKTGHVGYDYIHFRPITFCPLAMGSHGCGDQYVPFGSYHVSKEEEGPLHDYATKFFRVAEPAMELACSRLADAETRTRPQDRLVDAVIGMEALLLAGLGKEDRKGELKYRFSLHYSTLFDTAEKRHYAFRVAKKLYDLRSAIAHGSKLADDRHRVAEESLTLAGAADRATESLRKIICRFLPEANDTPYKKSEFWERAYFGLREHANE